MPFDHNHPQDHITLQHLDLDRPHAVVDLLASQAVVEDAGDRMLRLLTTEYQDLAAQ